MNGLRRVAVTVRGGPLSGECITGISAAGLAVAAMSQGSRSAGKVAREREFASLILFQFNR